MHVSPPVSWRDKQLENVLFCDSCYKLHPLQGTIAVCVSVHHTTYIYVQVLTVLRFQVSWLILNLFCEVPLNPRNISLINMVTRSSMRSQHALQVKNMRNKYTHGNHPTITFNYLNFVMSNILINKNKNKNTIG